MNITAYDEARAIEGPCCFWIKNSKTCANLKIATLATVTALTILTLLSVSILLYAKNGGSLYEISTIANQIDAIWIYYAGAFAVHLGIVNTFLIVTLARSYFDRFYSETELRTLGVLDDIEKSRVSDKLLPKHYWSFTQEVVKKEEGQAGSPAVYSIIFKDHQSQIRVRGFKTDVDRAAFIEKNGLKNGEEAFKRAPEYTKEFLLARFGNERFQREIKSLENNLPDGHYRRAELEIPGDEKIEGTNDPLQVDIVITKSASEEALFHYFKKEEEAQKTCGISKHFIDRDQIQKNIQAVYALHVRSLEASQFWNFHCLVDGKKHFVVAFMQPNSNQIDSWYFGSKDKRREEIGTRLKGYEDAKHLYQITYRKDEAEALAQPVGWAELENLSLEYETFCLYELKTTKDVLIYTELVRDKDITRIRYYREKRDFDEAINKLPSHLTNATEKLLKKKH